MIYMRRILTAIVLLGWALGAWAQQVPALEQLKKDPRKAYGTDYPYLFETHQLTGTSLSTSAIMPATVPAITGTSGCTRNWIRCWPVRTNWT